MKITYTGKSGQFTEAQNHKLEARFAKVAKLLDGGKGEREARVILSQERHLHHAEITANYKENSLVVVGSDADSFSAICDAVEKLEKQVLKLRAKRRETKRGSHKEAWQGEAEVIETFVDSGTTRKVFRTNHLDGRKPMSLDEALFEMEQDLDYLVFLDADTQRTSVLVRRRDGHFDLVEA